MESARIGRDMARTAGELGAQCKADTKDSERIEQSLRENAACVENAANRLCEVANRMWGIEPMPPHAAVGSGGKGEPETAAARIQGASDRLNRAILELETQARRFERLA